MLSANLAVIFFKYHINLSFVNRSSKGLLILLLKCLSLFYFLFLIMFAFLLNIMLHAQSLISA